jgi:hypothetical protein
MKQIYSVGVFFCSIGAAHASRAIFAIMFALVGICIAHAAPLGKVTGWGNSVVFPPQGYGATFTNVTAGGFHNLALKKDGTVVAWGRNDCAQSIVPNGLGPVITVAAGDYHSVALKPDGTIAAWGDNYYGETTMPSGLSGVVAIAAGGTHSLALRKDGTFVGWGDNSFSQSVGDNTSSNVVAIAAGRSHSLVLRRDGTVLAWGANGDGRASGQADVPSGLSGVVAIAAGEGQSLALFDAAFTNHPPIPAACHFAAQRDLPSAIVVADVLGFVLAFAGKGQRKPFAQLGGIQTGRVQKAHLPGFKIQLDTIVPQAVHAEYANSWTALPTQYLFRVAGIDVVPGYPQGSASQVESRRRIDARF